MRRSASHAAGVFCLLGLLAAAAARADTPDELVEKAEQSIKNRQIAQGIHLLNLALEDDPNQDRKSVV